MFSIEIKYEQLSDTDPRYILPANWGLDLESYTNSIKGFQPQAGLYAIVVDGVTFMGGCYLNKGDNDPYHGPTSISIAHEP